MLTCTKLLYMALYHLYTALYHLYTWLTIPVSRFSLVWFGIKSFPSTYRLYQLLVDGSKTDPIKVW